MPRFSNIILAYYLMGAIMWGGGMLPFADAGVVGVLVDEPTPGGGVNEETQSELSQIGGPIQEAVNSVGGGGLIAVFNLVAGLISYLFWPISALAANGAPTVVWVTFGGAPTAMFYGAMIRIVRTSA